MNTNFTLCIVYNPLLRFVVRGYCITNVISCIPDLSEVFVCSPSLSAALLNHDSAARCIFTCEPREATAATLCQCTQKSQTCFAFENADESRLSVKLSCFRLQRKLQESPTSEVWRRSAWHCRLKSIRFFLFGIKTWWLHATKDVKSISNMQRAKKRSKS